MKISIFNLAILATTTLSISQSMAASDGSGLQISAAVDVVGQRNTTPSGPATDRLDVREAEIMLYAPIDHIFDGTFSAAAHRESGESVLEIHEAFIGSSKFIPNSQFKLGQFFLGVGRLNQVHRHEWPFISPPKVQEQFFAEEAASDAGLEYSYLLPTSFYLNLTAGLTNGWTYGHSHTEGKKPQTSTHYARLSTYFDTFSEGGAQLGLNFLGRKSNEAVEMTLIGLDLTAKWRENNTLRHLFQTEVWHRTLKPANAKPEETLGLYVFPQYGFDSQYSLGARGDAYTVLSLEDATGSRIRNLDFAIVPTFTYKPSEFSTLRLAYNYLNSQQGANSPQIDGMVEVQATFILGSHPAHSF
jgi:hypothetical protein